MYVIKWFINKIKKLVQAYRDNRSRRQIEKWYSENEVTDEQLRQEAEANEQEYLRQCKEEDERIVKEEKELQAQILEDKRTEKIVEEEYQILQQIKDDIIWKREQCPRCGYSSWECTCYLDEDDEHVSEETIINRQNAVVDEDKMPQWLQEAHDLCPGCGFPRKSCTCDKEI